MKDKTRNIFFAFGLIAVAIMFATLHVSPAEMWACVCRTGHWLAAILLSWVALYMANAWTWRIIIRSSGPCPIPYWRLLKITITGFALNYATPMGLMGGEPYKILEAKPHIGAQRASSSVLLFAMMHIFAHFWSWVTGVAVYAALAALGILPLGGFMILVLALMAVFCAAGILLFLRGYKGGMVAKLLDTVSRIPGLGRKADEFAARHAADLRAVDIQIAHLHTRHKKSFWAAFTLEYVGRTACCFEVFFALLVFNAGQDSVMTFVTAYLILSFTSWFANLLFFLPLQLGGREGGFALSAAQMGASASVGMAVSIVCRIRELFWTLIGLLLMKMGNGMNQCATHNTNDKI